MISIQEQIAQNKRRTWLLILLFPAVFAVVTVGVLWVLVNMLGWQTAQSSSGQPWLYALPVLCWLAAMAWIAISYFKGDKLLLNSADAIPVTQQDQPEIYNLVENLCINRGLPLPRIYIMDDNSLNAFATGRDPQHASVALTKGIVKKLNREELEGVISHELSHVENRDIRLMLLTVAGISFFTFVGEICLKVGAASRYSRNNGNQGGASGIFFILGIICSLYGLVFAPLIRLAISRQREYLADATGASMTHNPYALASALRKISGDSRVEALDRRASMAAMCIENPLAKNNLFSWMTGLLATHPPIEKRIAALEQMPGGY